MIASRNTTARLKTALIGPNSLASSNNSKQPFSVVISLVEIWIVTPYDRHNLQIIQYLPCFSI